MSYWTTDLVVSGDSSSSSGRVLRIHTGTHTSRTIQCYVGGPLVQEATPNASGDVTFRLSGIASNDIILIVATDVPGSDNWAAALGLSADNGNRIQISTPRPVATYAAGDVCRMYVGAEGEAATTSTDLVHIAELYPGGEPGSDPDPIVWISDPKPPGTYPYSVTVEDSIGNVSTAETGTVTVASYARPATLLSVTSYTSGTDTLVLAFTASPDITAALSGYSGYNLYIGDGDLDDVVWTAEEGSAAAGDVVLTLVGYGYFAASHDYTLVLRPVYESLETPDVSCRCVFTLTAGGEWKGAVPAEPVAITAEAIAAAKVKVKWHYKTATGDTKPTDFGVYENAGSAPVVGTPDATVAYTVDGWYSHTFTLTNTTAYHFGVTARNATAVQSEITTTGPVTADSAAPTTPSSTVTKVYT